MLRPATKWRIGRLTLHRKKARVGLNALKMLTRPKSGAMAAAGPFVRSPRMNTAFEMIVTPPIADGSQGKICDRVSPSGDRDVPSESDQQRLRENSPGIDGSGCRAP
jgi:hypothetical protein